MRFAPRPCPGTTKGQWADAALVEAGNRDRVYYSTELIDFGADGEANTKPAAEPRRRPQ